jgi:RNA polymerase sigma-70 factor, ECF subfamily
MTVDDVLAETFRHERASVLATLIRRVGDFQLAEDAVQDAFADAVASWARDGVPLSPGAWITTAARRRAIDRLRRNRSITDRAERLAELARLDGAAAAEEPMTDSDDAVVDDRLRLMFTCCHPALAVPAQVALTLRTLGGLTTTEIARAFLVAEPTMGKRIVRAKSKIADAAIAYRVPAGHELPMRLGGVLRVVYLIFNEGYAATAGPNLVRASLCDEAIRLAKLLSELMPDSAEVWGLLALMQLHDARRDARVAADGTYASLDDQETDRWNLNELTAGQQALRRALRLDGAGEFQLQAAIAAIEIEGVLAGAIDWARVAALYAALQALKPSPVVAVNHAAAVGFANGAEAGIKLLQPLLGDPALAKYQPLYATHAELLRRRGDAAGAEHAYARALALTENSVERAELTRRLEAVQTAGPAAT